MLLVWRTDGYGRDVLEVWVMGYPTSVDYVNSFANGSEASCFLDTAGVFTAYGALVDDLFVIDAAGLVQFAMNLIEKPLSTDVNRTELDGQVRSLLP